MNQGRDLMKCAVDLVCLSLRRQGVGVLLAKSSRGAFRLPSALLKPRESLEEAAMALAQRVAPGKPRWREQAGVRTVDRHPLGARLAVTFITAFPGDAREKHTGEWCAASHLPPSLPACHRAAVAVSLETVRARADLSAPVFAMLSSEFTLSQLQRAYEILLGRVLHKASFRRTMRAARLIVATAAWRTNGRGRPARFYRRASRTTTPAGAGAAPAAPFRAPARRRRPRHDTARA